jgi:hypothetical protein
MLHPEVQSIHLSENMGINVTVGVYVYEAHKAHVCYTI